MSVVSKIPVNVSGASQFHKAGITGNGTTIAFLDSGLAPHDNIKRSRILAFRDFVNDSVKIYDDYSHGTHVTGIAAATSIGIAPECNLVILKILDSKGHSDTELFIKAIKWILIHHQSYNIRIVNISIGGNTATLCAKDNLINTWIKKLWSRDIIVCCSAGNNGPTPDSICAPGNCPEVITVGSYDGRNFSSAGPISENITKPEVVAPGHHILSLNTTNGYSIKSGTSMSVPFISGYCALLLQIEPSLSNENVKNHLMNCAYNVPYLPYNMQGAGIVSLDKLLLSIPLQETKVKSHQSAIGMSASYPHG
ncbi:MAG: S8 family serine peptidase [Lachnospiraceae bacterium]|nr:S8 family serine peptidase [Lachnospiraceae bacterium]